MQVKAPPYTNLMQGEERRDRRKIRQLHTVLPTTPLTTALSLLLDAGVSVLPIIDAVSMIFLSHAASHIMASHYSLSVALFLAQVLQRGHNALK